MSGPHIPSKTGGLGSSAVNAVDGVSQGVKSGAETEAFVTGMQGLQASANYATLATAGLTNTKSLMDGLGKVIKGQGDSVKDAAPR